MLKHLLLVALVAVTILCVTHEEVKPREVSRIEISSIEVMNAINKYSLIYEVPRDYVLKCAHQETSYSGVVNFDYNHKRVSSYGALGPFQVIYSTAKSMMKDSNFTKEDLKNNVDLNVHCGIKYMRYLYNIYHDWTIVYSYYNQGYVGVNNINSYARKITKGG